MELTVSFGADWTHKCGWCQTLQMNVVRAKEKSVQYTEPQKEALQCRNATYFNTRSKNLGKSSTTKKPNHP